jgi:hypothetical protein
MSEDDAAKLRELHSQFLVMRGQLKLFADREKGTKRARYQGGSTAWGCAADHLENAFPDAFKPKL